jgi:hypothetical protein
MPLPWKPVSKSALVIGGIGALAFFGHALTSRSGFLALDYVNLPVHEAGHLIFGLFGGTIGLWGGTLMQILMPALFAAYFFRRREIPGTAFSAFWTGESLLNIARYVADARAMDLPLVGGGEHDWNLILSGLRLLPYDTRIADALRLFGWTIMILAAAWFIREGLRGRSAESRR